MEKDRPENPDLRAGAVRDLALLWADARRRFELHRIEAGRKFEAEMGSWRARASASDRDAFDEETRLARLELQRRCDEVLESLSERHLPDPGTPGSPPPQEDLATTTARIRDALAGLDELEANCRAGIADADRQLELLTEAMASIPDEREREATLESIRSTLASSQAEAGELLADIARYRAELVDWLRNNQAG